MGASHSWGVAHSVVHVLIVDDDRNIHEDYVRCLRETRHDSQRLFELRGELFGWRFGHSSADEVDYVLTHAYDGLEAIEHVRGSVERGEPFALAFVDMRMPPGLNGIETIASIWNLDAAIQIVLSTAYSDFTWVDVIEGVGRTDGLHLLRKPFHHSQVRQFAGVLAKKWQLDGSAAPSIR
jgi:CheY-like chemotaxis protein